MGGNDCNQDQEAEMGDRLIQYPRRGLTRGINQNSQLLIIDALKPMPTQLPKTSKEEKLYCQSGNYLLSQGLMDGDMGNYFIYCAGEDDISGAIGLGLFEDALGVRLLGMHLAQTSDWYFLKGNFAKVKPVLDLLIFALRAMQSIHLDSRGELDIPIYNPDKLIV